MITQSVPTTGPIVGDSDLPPHPRIETAFPDHQGNAERKDLLLSFLDRFRPLLVKPASGFIKYPYCIPGGYYEQQWDWDGFFIACHLAGREDAKPEYLKYWALNVLCSKLPDGDIAACVDPEGPRTGHASLRLKPFLAQGVEIAGRLLGDDSWIEERYDEIVRIATRRESSHYKADYGLFVWENAMESGIDNNSAVGNDPERARTIAACDINSYYYREYLALAAVAGRLGRIEDAEHFNIRAAMLREALNRHLWDGDAQTYWNLDTVTGKHVKCVACSNFIPLWAGMATQEHGREMIARYLWNEDHLLCDFGLRSLSAMDPEYNNLNVINPYSNWQGPVWPIANYFYFVALTRYSFTEEARELVGRLTNLYLMDFDFCGSLHENYDAETGTPLAPSAGQSKQGLEGGFFGWNMLLVDMIEMADGKPHLLDAVD